MNEDLPSINDFVENRSNLPSLNESVESDLPSYKDFIEEKGDNIVVNMDGGVGGSWSVQTKEPDNIHELMYEIATKNVATTIQLDPLPPLGGGSETFQEGWQSGAGLL